MNPEQFRTVKPKPPLGLKPRYIHEEHRIQEISNAIQRYVDAKKAVPVEWIAEYNELVAKREESE